MTGATLAGAILIGLGAAHLLYTYAVYPWVVRLLPARMPKSAGTSAAPGLISVIIAVRVSARSDVASLTAKIRDLLNTAKLPSEVVVALDGADRELSAELEAIGDARLKVALLPIRAGKAAALNRGVELARGDVLVFTDLRQQIARGAIEELVAALASPDVGAVSGSLAMAGGGRGDGLYERYWRFERELRAREAAWDSAVGVSGALYALKRDLWRPLPAGLILDDVWVPFQVIRAGKRVGFAPQAVATDARAGSDAGELARKVRTLTGNYQLLAWMPSLLNPLRNRIWWQFMSHKVMRLLTPLAAASLAVGGLLLAGRWAWLVAVAGLAALGATALLRRPASPGVGLTGTLRSAMVLLVALVMAAVNAARGRWDVWTEAAR